LLPIRRIVQGPAVDPEMSTRAVELLMDRHGYGTVEIARSVVPLRF